MMYYWISMFVNEKRSAVRFFVPYILCTAFASYWVMIKHGVAVHFLFLALVIPFTCPLFFLLENKLKRVLAPHKITNMVLKAIGNVISGFVMLVFTILFIDIARGYLQPSRKHLFDDAKKLAKK